MESHFWYSFYWKHWNSHKKASNTIIDIDNEEANKLIKLIELLLKRWCVDNHDEQELYNDIIEIADAKNKSTSL